MAGIRSAARAASLIEKGLLGALAVIAGAFEIGHRMQQDTEGLV